LDAELFRTADGSVPLRKPYSKQSDVYGFGTLLWELISPDLPFIDCPEREVIAQICAVVRIEIPDCVPEYKEIIKDCWQHNLKRRPGFSNILQRLLAVSDTYSPPPPLAASPATVSPELSSSPIAAVESKLPLPLKSSPVMRIRRLASGSVSQPLKDAPPPSVVRSFPLLSEISISFIQYRCIYVKWRW
jgi:hypothetical protein